MPPAASGDALRRLERRIRIRLDLKVALKRALASVPAAVQIVVASIASYSIAHFAFGHPTPLLAITVVISTLGFGRDARPRHGDGHVQHRAEVAAAVDLGGVDALRRDREQELSQQEDREGVSEPHRDY